MERRKFIATSGTLALTSLIALQCKTKQIANAAGLENIGLQLYTVRDDMQNDPLGTLKVIADIGYTHVESAGYSEGMYYGMSPKQFNKALSDLGLKMYTGHTRTGYTDLSMTHTMSNNWEAVCEDAASIGQKYLICGWLAPEERGTLDDYKRTAELFNKCGEISNQYEIKTGFHNHDFEFVKLDGQVPYDVLLSETDSDKVCFELDHYWTTKAGVDGLAILNKHKGRFPLWHIKDMDNSSEQFFTEVGSGVINWKKIFETAPSTGMQYFFVEQDQCRNFRPLESIEIGHDYLASLQV